MHRTISNQCGRLLSKLGWLAKASLVADRFSTPRSVRSIDCLELEDRILFSAAPVGNQTLVSTTAAPPQQALGSNAVATDAQGDFVVTWANTGSSGGVFAQLYNSAGQAEGSQISVSTTTPGDQATPAVAMSSSGSFVVTWADESSGSWQIMAQRFDASGNALGSNFVVNTDTGTQEYPDIAMDPSGNFVITWSDNTSGNNWGTRARMYNSSGDALTGQIQVNTYTAGNQEFSSIAMDAADNFVITWSSDSGEDGSGWGVYAQMFNSSGSLVGSQFQVNTTTANDQEYSQVAMDSSGAFVITWSSDDGQDGSGWGVYAQQYNSSGGTVGGEFQVNTITSGDQLLPAIYMDPAGDFTITWSDDSSGSWNVAAQEFNSSANPLGSQFVVNTTSSGDQGLSSIAYQTGGQYVVAWYGENVSGNTGVFYQLFDNGINQPPVNTVPGAQSTNENTPLVFSTTNGNAISISDPDADGGQEQLTLSVSDGTLTLAGTSGLTFTSGTGSGNSTMTFTGTLANINAALNGLTYQPTNGYVGGDTLQISTDDLGNTGYGSAQITNSSVALSVNAYTNQAPVNTVPGPQSTNENTSLVFSTSNGNGISVSDVDADGSPEQVTLSVSDGTLSLSGTSGLTFSTGTGSNNSTMTFAGTLANINAALNGLTYAPTASYFGSDTLQISTNDLGNTGGGGPQTTNSSVAITVNEVNQPPVNTVPGAQSVDENASLVFSTATSNAISVSDVDADGNPEQVTLTVSNGTLSLADTTGLTFSTGTGSGNSTMTFTGTLANINAALNGLTYNPTTGYFGSDNLAISTNDLGNTGLGGPQTANSSVAITVNEVNQPPVNTVPGPQTLNEDGSLVFSTATSNAISVSDVDADGNPEQVTLTVSNGTLTLADTTGLTFSTGTGSGNSTMTFTGTLANINAALNGLTYKSSFRWYGGDSLSISTDDLGNTGLGGPKTTNSSVEITVNEVNQPPVNTVPGAQSVDENASLVFSTATSNAISVSDVDADGNPEQVTLTVSNGTLTLADTTGLTFSTGTGSGNSTMTFTGTLANINTALNGLTYNPTTSYFGSDSLAISTDDLGHTGFGGPQTTNSSVAITVNEVDQPPVNTVPGAQSVDENASLVFSTATSNAISVSDVDADGNPEQVTLTVGNGTLTLAGTTGLTFSTGTGSGNSTMTFTGTLANINAALNGLTYNPTTSYFGSDSLAISTDDLGHTGFGGPQTTNSSVAITVNEVDQPPVNTVPGAQSVDENASLVFSTATSNAISVSDVDADGNPEQVTLTVSNGTLTLAGTTGLTFSTGTGSANSTMTFTGTLANINAALNGLTYSPTTGYFGSDNLAISTNDLGNTGLGGPQTANSSVAITVNEVNQPPVNTVPGAQSVDENAALVFSTATSNAISVSDVDADGNPEQVTLTVSNGTLTLADTTGLTFSTGTGSGNSTMTFTGTLGNINAALNGLTYNPTTSYFGSDSLAISTNDLGNTGLGGPKTTNSSVAITVNEVNQPPVNTVPGAQSVDENASLVFSTATSNAISVSDVDADGNPEQVTLSAGNGTLTLAGTTGLTFSSGTGSGNSTMTFTGTLANINAALNGLTYNPTTSYFGSDSLAISTNDLGNTGLGGPKTANSSVAITVNEVNQPPVNTVPGAQSVNENSSLVFSTATSNAISVSDVDADGNPEQVTLSAGNGTLTLAGTSGLTFSTGTGSHNSSMTFTGTLANINAALNGLTYTPNTYYYGNDSLAVSTNDLGNTGLGGPLTTTNSVALTVAQLDGAPIVSIPGSQVVQGTNLVFSPSTSNAISVTENGPGGQTVELTLTASGGTISLPSTAGVTIVSGSTAGSAQVELTGSVASVNGVLSGLSFQPAAYSATLQVVATDVGALPGQQTSTSSVTITQTPLILLGTTQITATSTTAAKTNSDTIVAIDPRQLSPALEPMFANPQQAAEEPAQPRRVASGPAPTTQSGPKLVQLDEAPLAEGQAAPTEDAALLARGDLRTARRTALADYRRAGMFDADLLWGSIQTIANQLKGRTDDSAILTVGAAAGLTAALSAGYMVWCLRAGTLLAGVLSSLPLWRNFDPLPVLEFWEKKKGDDDDMSEEPDELDLSSRPAEPEELAV